MTSEQMSILVTAAAAGVTALATGVLAWVTWLLFGATQRMAQAAREPNVIATIEPTRWSTMHLDLRTENIGTGPAYDVQVSFNPPLLRDRGGKATEIHLNAISVLRPTAAIQNFIGTGSEFIDNAYTATISWKRSPTDKARVQVVYRIDLAHWKDVTTLGSGDPLVKIAQELKKSREDFQRILSGFKRLGVDIYNSDDRQRERATLEAHFREEEKALRPAPTRKRKPRAPKT